MMTHFYQMHFLYCLLFAIFLDICVSQNAVVIVAKPKSQKRFCNRIIIFCGVIKKDFPRRKGKHIVILYLHSVGKLQKLSHSKFIITLLTSDLMRGIKQLLSKGIKVLFPANFVLDLLN